MRSKERKRGACQMPSPSLHPVGLPLSAHPSFKSRDMGDGTITAALFLASFSTSPLSVSTLMDIEEGQERERDGQRICSNVPPLCLSVSSRLPLSVCLPLPSLPMSTLLSISMIPDIQKKVSIAVAMKNERRTD